MKNKKAQNLKESTSHQEEIFRKSSPHFLVFILILVLFLGVIGGFMSKDKNTSTGNNEVPNHALSSMYRLSGNALENFDLRFLQLENEQTNKLYSPLSIKYALMMLQEGADGESKKQISNIIGTYQPKKYVNTENMSFANALFVKDSYKSSIKDSYIHALSNQYNAHVIYDSFVTPNVLNSWVKNQTFQLIDHLSDDLSNQDFILVNSLALDMEWVNKIQDEKEEYKVEYMHEKFQKRVLPLQFSDYHSLDFENISYPVKSAEIGAVINKYDIISDLGADNIRKTVGKEYEEWIAENADVLAAQKEWSIKQGYEYDGYPDTDTYLDAYIEELHSNYRKISSSTDFKFYVDDAVKMFAKDLKEYDGTTLQYIGIMPKHEQLDSYIKNIKAEQFNTLIQRLKPIELDSFQDGVITEISGYIPMFQFDYELNLMDDLKQLGITDVFDADKANLSLLTSDSAFINQATHKSNIEFSNEGIKASAATSLYGFGAAHWGFDYLYDVPVEHIDLTFDHPYLFLLRDKNSGEVWFIGTVYEPLEYQETTSID